MTETIVRPVEKSELDVLLPLFEAYRAFYGRPPAPEAVYRFLAERLAVPGTGLALAWCGSEALGFVHLVPQYSSLSLTPTFYLSDLYVTPVARGEGLGRRLLDWALAHARHEGATGLSLETARDNHRAQALYRSCGWTRDDEFLVFQRDTGILPV